MKIDSELKKYLPYILDQAKNGIIVSDPNQKGNPVIFVNQTTCNTFGYSKEEFLGKNCSFLQGDDTKQKELEAIRKAINNKRSITVTVRNYKKSGELVHNQFTISPIFDEKKKLKYFLGIQKDVTKEILLKRENEALLNERLEHVQNEAIGKLSAGLSHEINTPLTAINGSLEMMKLTLESISGEDKQEILEDLSVIENNLNRIQNIVETIREASDTKNFEAKKINLYRALVMALRLTYHKSKHISKIILLDKEFSLDLDRELKNFTVYGDSKKLEQVFIALINNALDQLQVHGDIDTNLLKIDIEQADKEFVLSFEDNGGGIDEKLLQEVFKPFSSGKSYKGLGIGLSIVKKIIDKHGFDITLQNKNQGVVVSIAIPAT